MHPGSQTNLCTKEVREKPNSYATTASQNAVSGPTQWIGTIYNKHTTQSGELTLAGAFRYVIQKSTSALRLDSLWLIPSTSMAEKGATTATRTMINKEEDYAPHKKEEAYNAKQMFSSGYMSALPKISVLVVCMTSKSTSWVLPLPSMNVQDLPREKSRVTCIKYCMWYPLISILQDMLPKTRGVTDIAPYIKLIDGMLLTSI